MTYVEVRWDSLRYFIREDIFKEKVNVHEIHFHGRLEDVADIVIDTQTNRFKKNKTQTLLSDYVKSVHGAPSIVILR